MTRELQSQITALIPSNSLKRQLSLSGFSLTDADLLTIAYRYAPDFDTRIDLLRRLAQCFSGELKAYTSRLVSVQQRMLESFLTRGDGEVYELHIKDTPDAYDERYLCRSFEEAMNFIPHFFREYDCEEKAVSRYTIVKRRILSAETGFSEDALGELVLLPGGKIHSVTVFAFDHRAEECCGQCLACDRPCAHCHETLFPVFVRHGDAVKYYESSGKESFGIAFSLNDRPCSDCYVIPLDSEAVRHHDFANLHDAHQHIPAPLTERIKPEELPEDRKDDYQACLLYIMENRPAAK